MLGIGRHTDYASRIVLHLASLEDGAQVSAAEIASRRLLPPAFVRRIVGKLASAGILRTTRGAGGGVALAGSAAEISLLDIVVAMEGGLLLNACVDEPSACPLAVSCPVHCAWTDATRQLAARLGEVRFDRLAGSITTPLRKATGASPKGRRATPASSPRRRVKA
ncbi:MAG: RrF2 family transcriptional regulator [Thermoanaerobaculaceae bacterium]